MNADGEFVGETCHIEGAMPGSERFNEKMTNEARRSFPNLILLCREHHIITNNVDKFKTPNMQRMKADHEAIYADPVAKMTESFVDQTKVATTFKPTSLRRINEVLGWGNDEDELDGTVEYFDDLADSLQPVPRRPKQIFAAIINRGKHIHSSHLFFVRVLFHDLCEALEISPDDLKTQLDVLEEHNLVEVIEDEGKWYIETKGNPDWNILEELKKFCDKSGVSLNEIIVDGKYDLLD